MEPTVIQDKALTCAHCGGAHFAHRRAQLNTALATFFGVDALDTSADVYACRRCGRLEWFLEPDLAYLAQITPAPDASRTVECPECNMLVPAGKALCGSCGWRRT